MTPAPNFPVTVDSYLDKMISDLAPGTILCCFKKLLLSKIVSSGSGNFRFAGASGIDNVQRNMRHFVLQFSRLPASKVAQHIRHTATCICGVVISVFEHYLSCVMRKPAYCICDIR